MNDNTNSDSESESNQEIIIADKYILLDQIGKGSFGAVFKGVYHNRINNEYVAIKMEKKDSANSLLKHETTMLRYLNDNHCQKIPDVHWYGLHDDDRVLVMTYYDCSLMDYYKNCSDKHSKLDSIMYNAIHILNSVHINHIIHRDKAHQSYGSPSSNSATSI